MFNLIGVIWHGLFGPGLFLLDWSLGVCSVGDLAYPQNGPYTRDSKPFLLMRKFNCQVRRLITYLLHCASTKIKK